MFKGIIDGKIKSISDVGEFPCQTFDAVVEDTEHTCEDYEQYNGEYLLKSEIPAPTEEEQRQKREVAYTQEVDPITCHISRLSDEEQTPEIEQEIVELKQERSAKVENIKRRYPYPVGE